MELTTLVIAILATWRITALFYWDKGPWEVFLRLRQWATWMDEEEDDGLVFSEYRRPFWAELFKCFWCLSLWVGLLVTLLALVAWWILLPFALSGAAVLLSGGGRLIWRSMAE